MTAVTVAVTLAWLGSAAPGAFLAGRAALLSAAGADPAPVYTPDPIPPDLQKQLELKKYKRDPKSGNYLGPKVSSRTPNEDLVPVLIGGRYVKDLKGRPVFVRQSIRDKLLKADAAMFKEKKAHLQITYGFRSNALQLELYRKLAGKGKVAPIGLSFHEAGMAVDVANWQDAQKFMIEAGFVGGCYGIEEDLVHYSINEITKASNFSAFKRCTLKEIPKHILEGVKKVGGGVKKVGGAIGGVFK
jgi:hypothetical protein